MLKGGANSSILKCPLYAALVPAALFLLSCGGGGIRSYPSPPSSPPTAAPKPPAQSTPAPESIEGEYLALTADPAALLGWAVARGISAREISDGKTGSAADESGAALSYVLLQTGDSDSIKSAANVSGVFFACERRRYRASSVAAQAARGASFLPNDPFFVDSDVDNTTVPPTLIPYQKTTLEPVSVEGGWDFARGVGVKVALVSSGVYQAHPDLSGRISALSRSFKEVSGDVVEGNNIDDEAPGVEGAIGTYLAGVIAANIDDGVGMAGIAPECKLIVLKTGSVVNAPGPAWMMTDLEVNAALRYAADNGANVVVLPLAVVSTPQIESVIEEALAYCLTKRVTVVVPAGDNAAPISASQVYPANSAASNIVAVGGLYIPATVKLPTSNFDASGVVLDIAAPGFAVIATDQRPEDLGADPPITGYVYASGTAVSAAIVAGAIALMDEALGGAYTSPSLVIPILFGQGDTWASIGVPDPQAGKVRLNVNRAVAGAKSQVGRPVALVINSVSTTPPSGRNATTFLSAFIRPVVSGGIPPYKVHLDWGDGTTYPPSTAFAPYSNPVFSHVYASAGRYPVTIAFRDSAGQERAIGMSFNVMNPLSASISYVQNPAIPRQFRFFADVVNSDTLSPNYYWDFDGDWVFDSFVQNPIHTYSAAGVYTVRFQVIDGRGPATREMVLTVP